MSIWKGWGVLGFLPLIIAVFVFRMAAQFGFPHRGDGPQTGAILALGAIGLWGLGRRLNRGTNGIRDARHSMFLLPVQFYAVPLFAAGVLMAVATSLAPP